MRAILIDWIIDVHNKFSMRPQTLFMTVNLIDRYLEKYDCPRNELQLVGISSLFLASKYEEIYPPDLPEFYIICDKTYTEKQILDMEGDIILALNFDLVFSSSYFYFEMFSKKRKFTVMLVGIKRETYSMGHFLLFISTMEFSLMKHRPSQLALSAIFLANKFLKSGKWFEELPGVVGCSEHDIKNCALELFLLLQKVKKSTLTAALRKYESEEHFGVSQISIKL